MRTRQARALRRAMTEAENKLWKLLRAGQLGGFSFRRQHPIGPFIADFYCPQIKLVVELDGGQHGLDAHKQKDRARTKWLNERSIFLQRFWNVDVLKNPDGVLRLIAIQISALSENDPHPASPLQGEAQASR
ncbi:MAG: DUF559 domain-containing protein [Rhodospirillaceae bacterium]|nr:DUF559 domain-containing protein [Rhodospirillaceae bacterium]